MNLKTKAFGIIAGAAISISLITGAAAAEGGTTTTLKPAAGSCTAAATSGSIDLGTWNWNATNNSYDYVASSGAGTITTEVTQTIQPNITCNVTLKVSELQGPGTSKISGVLDSARSGGSGSGGNYKVPTSAQGATLEVAATLPAVPVDAAPGTYTGTITVDSANAGK